MLRKSFPYRFLAARLTRLPLVGRLMEMALFKGDNLVVLPPRGLIEVREEVPCGEGRIPVPQAVVEHFIEKGFIWIMDRCICREATGCSNYPVDLGCIFMGEAARGINPGLGRPASREEALSHLAECRKAGLFQIVGRNKLDTVWLGVGPGNRLLTVCNCCTCCCLGRILPGVSGSIGEKITRMPGLRLEVGDECQGCGACLEVPCLTGALRLVGGRVEAGEECRGCGRCAEACPRKAIKLVVEDSDFVRRAIERIAPLVDVS